mgnify:CR=1 FL=1
MHDSKSTEERQKEIIEAAKVLFYEKGYEQTSTVDIMRAVGIAKGTLYYHFAAKEEILDAMIESITDSMAERANRVCQDESLSVVERMVMIIEAISMDEKDSSAVMEAIHLPQNALLHEKSYNLMIEKISPIMLKAVEKGIDKKLFQTEYPKSAVDMAMRYSLKAFDGQADEYIIKGFIYNLERILGAAHGSLDYFYKLFE